jgi:hypothetical protein
MRRVLLAVGLVAMAAALAWTAFGLAWPLPCC